ncbi:MAG: thymidine kinase [Fimbriimonadaceae bacterium]|nr:thymidine kinase [Fimbriimonadaceae bacterium]
MKKSGTLTVVCGSMYAGKSEELIRLARRALFAKRKVQVFKPKVDDRYHETMVVTHMGVRHEAVAVKSVCDIAAAVEPDTDLVCIEEAQFFERELVDLAVALTDKGIDVVAAGLDQDFRRRPFGPMAELLIAADEVLKLRAICMNCGDTASHTYRMIDGKPAHWDDPVVLIGATESYEARCHRCFSLRGAPKNPFTGKRPKESAKSSK